MKKILTLGIWRMFCPSLGVCQSAQTVRYLGLLIVLLVSVLTIHAATLPEGTPTYQFTLNGTSYICYAEEASSGHYGWLDIYALPSAPGIKTASVQLKFSDKIIRPFIPAGYHYTYYDTKFVDDEWAKCTDLRTLELIGISRSVQGYNNLSMLDKVPSIKNVVVSGDISDKGWKFAGVKASDLKGRLFYSDAKLYDINDKKISSYSIAAIGSSLLDTEFKLSTASCERFGFAPEVNVRSCFSDGSNVEPLTEEWHSVTFADDGTPDIPSIGKYQYQVKIPELFGLSDNIVKTDIYTAASIKINDFFARETFFAYSILTPIQSKLDEYGFISVSINTSGSSLQAVEPDVNNGYKLIGTHNYDITFTHPKFPHKVREYIGTSSPIDFVNAQWQPHSVTLTFNIPADTNLSDYYVKEVWSRSGEEDNHEEYFRITGKTMTFTHDTGKCYFAFENKSKFKWYWYAANPRWYGIYQYINGEYVYLGKATAQTVNRDYDERRQLVIYANGFTIPLNYLYGINSVRQVGVISQGKEYNGRYDTGATVATVDNLMPGEVWNNLSLYYEIDGKRIILESDGISTYNRPKEISHKEAIVTRNAQSLIINFTPKGYLSSGGHVEYRDVYTFVGYNVVHPEALSHTSFVFEGLTPYTNYNISYKAYYVRNDDGKTKYLEFPSTYETYLQTSTDLPKWSEGTSEALTTTRARLKYSSNLNNVTDSYVEWRRVDAPAVVQSSKAICPVVNGILMGILNNLNPDVYYQFRPVYEYSSKKYYGEWVGIFTGDANVWFDPEVTTSPARVSEDGTVTLRGAVLPGSGDVSEQGFEIWPVTDASYTHAYNSERVDASRRFIPCDGISMAVEVSDLPAGTTYAYRTYAKVGTKSYTGSEMTFTTPGTGGIGQTTADAAEPEIVGYYNLQGVRSDRPMPGLNIVVYSNGTTEKRIFRDI